MCSLESRRKPWRPVQLVRLSCLNGSFWTHYDGGSGEQLQPADQVNALDRLHAGMRNVDVATPHFTDRVAEAEHLVANSARAPGLDGAGRALPLDTLGSARQTIDRANATEQLLHGEPHPGNVLNTAEGPGFIDLETCCRGLVEFDLAHVPRAVFRRYPNVDHDLLHEYRRLVHAMVAAWRWDVDDQFPDGLRHGHNILD
ncbi:MAG: phosphotransferase [Acidimicrobiales bacterium]